MKKLICLILGAVMIICMTGWTTGDVWSPEAFDEKTPSNYSNTDKIIASNDKFDLLWIAADCNVDLIEKATGKRWGVTARKEGEPTVNPVTGMPIKAMPELASALILEVLDTANNQTNEYFSAVGAVKNGRVVTEDIDNGIRIYYYFDELSIRIAVDFVLREDSVSATVDPNLIQEGPDYRAVSVKIAPYWCYNPNDAKDSYIFYPSGSGTLVSNESGSSAGTKVEAQVYGYDYSMPLDEKATTSKEIRYPVYGAVTGNIGTAAIIEENAEAAIIGAKTGSTSLKFSGVYTKFELRGHSTSTIQELSSEQTTQEVYALSLGQKPLTVGFYPLTGEDANYSGMAKAYKNYLKKSGALKETKEESPLNVTFVGGVMIDKSFLGLPYRDLVPATTVKQAQEILTELSTKTKTKISAKLMGYGSTGVEYEKYAGGFTLNKNLGSVKDLSALNDYATSNNIDLYFDFDLIKLKNSSSGYSTFFDSAYSSLLKTTVVSKYNAATRTTLADTGYYLLKRELLMDGAEKMLKKTSKWNLSGVSLEALSNVAYSDNSTQTTEYFTKGNMAKDVTDIFNKVSETYKIASADANAYAALASNIVYDSPTVSSGERIFTQDVPFYQMVFKGYVPLTTESINLAADSKRQILKTVESGAGLNYTLIANYYNEFIDYRGYYFFGSEYKGISGEIVETVNQLGDYYEAINGAQITSHTILDSGLRETIYSNGVKVYVNYTQASIAAPNGTTVEAEGYVWEK